MQENSEVRVESAGSNLMMPSMKTQKKILRLSGRPRSYLNLPGIKVAIRMYKNNG